MNLAKQEVRESSFLKRILEFQVAEKYYDETIGYSIEFSDKDIKDAMKFRLKMKKKKKALSYVDALGYTIATRMKIRFLTGDNAFEKVPNVEYVK